MNEILAFGLTREELQKAADYLNKLGLGEVKPARLNLGICFNFKPVASMVINGQLLKSVSV